MKHNLQYHWRIECGQPPRYNCPYCVYRTKHSSNVRAHVRRIHPGHRVFVVDIRKTDIPQFFWILPSPNTIYGRVCVDVFVIYLSRLCDVWYCSCKVQLLKHISKRLNHCFSFLHCAKIICLSSTVAHFVRD